MHSWIRRRIVLAAPGIFAAYAATAQPKVRRVGVLSPRARATPSNPEPLYDGFTQGMRELGYVDGKNIAIEWRFAEGRPERFPGLAAELVRLNVEVILTGGQAPTRALQLATTSIPIVTGALNDPVGSGFAKSLARPGGNITGLSLVSVDVTPKQLELLKELLPKLSTVGVLLNPDNTSLLGLVSGVRAAAEKMGIAVRAVEANSVTQIEQAFASLARDRVDGTIVLPDTYLLGQARPIAGSALKHRMPTIFGIREFVVAGGLMSYGQNIFEFYRRAAVFVDKILKGAKPAELPFEQPTQIHFALNRKTANSLGLKPSRDLLFRLDELIE